MAHDRKFRFGVQCSSAASPGEWQERARKMEDLGYSTLFAPDHFVGTPIAPMVGIAMAAEATNTLRVGHLVLANDYKHPAIVAKETATIDLLSDGRVELGIGAGWMTADYEALGIPYDRPGVRIARLAEALTVIKGCFTGEPFSFAGEHYTITNYTAEPRPVQQPHPPILIGGGGRKVLQLAAREADIIGINPNLRKGEITADAVQSALADATTEKVEWIKEAAGDRFDDLELQIRYFVAAVTDDPMSLAEAIAPGFGLEPEAALESGVTLCGSVQQCIDILEERREKWHVSYVVLGEDTFEQFAPVVAALAGT